MSIIYSLDDGPIVWPLTDLHDPNSKKYYYLDYRPNTRVNTAPYTKGLDIVIPAVFNGCMYECVSGGISATAEPIFTTKEGGFVDDGDVKWKCKTYAARLGIGDIITASSWVSDVGVTLSGGSILSGITTGIKVESVDPILKKFTLTNHITINRISGVQEEFDKSLIITLKNL
jgi:hypothetical protein